MLDILTFACSKLKTLVFQFSNLHGLVACGGEDGAVECFDMRTRSSVGRINAVAAAGDVDQVAILLLNLWLYVNYILISGEGKGVLISHRLSFDTFSKSQ